MHNRQGFVQEHPIKSGEPRQQRRWLPMAQRLSPETKLQFTMLRKGSPEEVMVVAVKKAMSEAMAKMKPKDWPDVPDLIRACADQVVIEDIFAR
jgi:hypothetical protein